DALPVAVAIALAWGHWKGQPLDALTLDFVFHLLRNHRLEVALDVRSLVQRNHCAKLPARRRLPITVTALERGAGTTTVGLEIAVGLAMAGNDVSFWEHESDAYLRLGLMGPGRHEPSGLEVLGGPDAPLRRP